MRDIRHLFALGVFSLALTPSLLEAQATDPAQSITAEAIARHVSVIADDSMLGRDTPSPGLERTARYIAAEFEKIGLTPDGNDTRIPKSERWLEWYHVPLRLDFARSRVVFSFGGQKASAGFTTAARLAGETNVPAQPLLPSTDVILMTGWLAEPDKVDRFQGKTLLYVMPAGVDSTTRGTLSWQVRMRYGAAAASVIILSEEDSTTFDRRLRAALQLPIVQRRSHMQNLAPAVYVKAEAVEGLMELLTTAGVDLRKARADSVPTVRELPILQIAIESQFQGTSSDTTLAYSVAAVLEGRDETLKQEYVLFFAHMDQAGVTSGRPDSIANGANDNASGTAGLIELARAFSQPGARPRRSLAFIAVSGGMKEHLWGARAFANTMHGIWGPRWSPDDDVAVVDLDAIGGGAQDSVYINGLSTLQLSVPLSWTVSAHAKQLTVVDGGQVFIPHSSVFPFAREGKPSLYVHAGAHGESRPEDVPSAVDADQAAKIMRLVFHIGQALANAPTTPQLNEKGREQFLRFLEQRPRLD